MASKRAIARASPKAKAFVVEEVGAKFNGHASLPDLISIEISELFAIDDNLLLVNETIFLECLFNDGSIFIISSVSPEFEINKTISFLLTRPMSPCAASVG